MQPTRPAREPLTPYPQMRARAVHRRVRNVDIPIVGVDDLIRMKRAAGRPRDMADIAALTGVGSGEDQ